MLVSMTQERALHTRGVDLERPNPARIYDWYLGGTANWAIDRELGEKTLQAFPLTRDLARANRGFLDAVVRYCLEQGVDQFLDLGSGVPTVGNVHEVADSVSPSSHCVYVDYEPIAVAHAQVLLERDGDPARHAVLHADLRDADYVWDQAVQSGLLDPGKPVALLLMSVLHFIADDQEVARTLGRYRELLAGGSFVAASHITEEGLPDELAARVREGVALYKQSSSPIRSRTRAEFKALFTGLDVVAPGVVSAAQWHTEMSEPNPAYQVFLAACAHTT